MTFESAADIGRQPICLHVSDVMHDTRSFIANGLTLSEEPSGSEKSGGAHAPSQSHLDNVPAKGRTRTMSATEHSVQRHWTLHERSGSAANAKSSDRCNALFCRARCTRSRFTLFMPSYPLTPLDARRAAPVECALMSVQSTGSGSRFHFLPG